MPFPDVDRTGYGSIHRAQQCQRPFLKLEGRSIQRHGVIIEAKSLSEPGFTELPVERVRIGKRKAFAGNGYIYPLLRHGQLELHLEVSAQLYGLYQRLKTFPRHPERISPGFQIWGRKFALLVR